MTGFVAIDTGGTFTDLVAYDRDTRQLRVTKAFTTKQDPEIGILDTLSKADIDLRQISLAKHGTTLVINALIERPGSRVALVTTKGFRDVLEVGRGNRVEAFNLFFRRLPALIPRHMRFELDERIDGQGNVLVKPCPAALKLLVKDIIAANPEAIAVSFLNSYKFPQHEQQVAEWLRALLPGVFVTTGSEFTRVWYEYERTSTVAANAYTGALVRRYVSRLDSSLENGGFRGQFWLMGSNGGLLTPEQSSRAPILLVESGPVGGCVGAGAFAKALNIQDLVAFDMGGTTAKCALVRNGEFEVESTYYVGGYGRGVPVRAPVVDIIEVGAGGGSIAWLDDERNLRVGPKSAGARPGAVAYQFGGTDPTVTDANLVLGRLNAKNFQGGELPLDSDAAEQAIRDKLAIPLGYEDRAGMQKIASGILSIAAVTMSEAIKQITVARGHDPSAFTLFAYGGGGPLHAVELARELGIASVIIPPEAGNFAAFGMLLARIRREQSYTFMAQLDARALDRVDQIFNEIEHELESQIGNDFGPVSVRQERSIEMRFSGQFHSVKIAAEELDVEALKHRFISTYRTRYGHAIDHVPVELVSVHVVATAELEQPELSHLVRPRHFPLSIKPGERKVFFHGLNRELSTAVLQREELPVGYSGYGPAIVEEYGTSTLITPGDRFDIGHLNEIRVLVRRRNASDTSASIKL